MNNVKRMKLLLRNTWIVVDVEETTLEEGVLRRLSFLTSGGVIPIPRCLFCGALNTTGSPILLIRFAEEVGDFEPGEPVDIFCNRKCCKDYRNAQFNGTLNQRPAIRKMQQTFEELPE